MLRAGRRWTPRGRRCQQFATFTSALLFAMPIVDAVYAAFRIERRPIQSQAVSKPPRTVDVVGCQRRGLETLDRRGVGQRPESVSCPRTVDPTCAIDPRSCSCALKGPSVLSCFLLHSQHKLSFASPDVLPKRGGDLRMALSEFERPGHKRASASHCATASQRCPRNLSLQLPCPCSLSSFIERLLILPQFVWIPERCSERVRCLSLHPLLPLWEF
ncbi:hypothetical protein K505DRAFT_53215 [Melanomma pulvis-pyrius CBS 109.77]|uniref:Uncharacterized protein n=1 Tax=Melanomma pulvis-pyrius CBS 109.77 TaxID=1314802 RepID=A0A6A6X8T2_9PLEO|nr:hypothetical protein K505DRAFT_53215 [Melanomma pulvis-pyrius CBS 109.77]